MSGNAPEWDPPFCEAGTNYARLQRPLHSGPARSLLLSVCVTLFTSFIEYHSTSDVGAREAIAARTYTSTQSYDDPSWYLLGGTLLDEEQWHYNPLSLNLANIDFLLTLSLEPLEWAGKVRREMVSFS
jgi:hypothetical protein